MSNQVNFSTNSAQIVSAHQKILQADPSISWAVFGFDKGTNDLNLEATGPGDLQEMVEEFDYGKVQYAFARVLDPNTKLNKFVFISWCGSGVPIFKKGLLGSQIGDVQSFLKGYHVSINARSEDDIIPENILQKIEESSGSRYSASSSKKSNISPAAAPQKPATKPAVYGVPTMPHNLPSTNTSKQFVNTYTKQQSQNTPIIPEKPQKTSYLPKMSSSSKPATATYGSQIGGTKPLFTGGKPVLSYFGSKTINTSPPLSNTNTTASFKSPQSPKSYGANTTKTTPKFEIKTNPSHSSETSVKSEATSSVSQAEQTKNELAMLRGKKLASGDLGASQNTFKSSNNEYEARKSELENIRSIRSAGESSSFNQSQPKSPNYSSPVQPKSTQSVRSIGANSFTNPPSHTSSQIKSAPYGNKAAETESQKNQAIVLYSYQAEKSDEMDLNEGEIVSNVEFINETWWSGSNSDGTRQGLFPANFVEMIDHNSDEHQTATHSTFTYNAQTSNAYSPPSKVATVPPPPPPPAASTSPSPAAYAPPPPPPPVSYVPPPPPPPPPAASSPSPAVYTPPPPPPPPPAVSTPVTHAPPPPPPPPVVPDTSDAPPPLPRREIDSNEFNSYQDEESPPQLPTRNNGLAETNEQHHAAAPLNSNQPQGYDEEEFTATALYDYEAAEDGELTFNDGEKIYGVEFPSEEWWQGFNSKGEFGLFPASYVALDTE
ncbi:hypothetical protein BB558_004195 [Smittium angustum]|uniref:Uncharacterized protein n=1 Tax=Smittium angustum TaxID=133377 RepID=A0A2U1J447_SMIAN|nr:hypothetical protein BB558_004195 [Smittium angustum]